jgi:hypothetical protein
MESTTRELKMGDGLVPVIIKLQEELKELQNQYKVKSDQLGTIVSTICLQENIDLSKQSLELSPDSTILYINDLPVKETEVTPKSKNKKK